MTVEEFALHLLTYPDSIRKLPLTYRRVSDRTQVEIESDDLNTDSIEITPWPNQTYAQTLQIGD